MATWGEWIYSFFYTPESFSSQPKKETPKLNFVFEPEFQSKLSKQREKMIELLPMTPRTSPFKPISSPKPFLNPELLKNHSQNLKNEIFIKTQKIRQSIENE